MNCPLGMIQTRLIQIRAVWNVCCFADKFNSLTIRQVSNHRSYQRSGDDPTENGSCGGRSGGDKRKKETNEKQIEGNNNNKSLINDK